MSFLDRLKASNAWDQRFNLPTCPELNNPWIYMAYADLLLRLQGERLDRMVISAHFLACESTHASGLFDRWPDHSGGITSYDEILGAAYFSPIIAGWILDYLEKMDGEFNNTGELPTTPERFNVFRLLFLKPYLQACAVDRRVSLISQAIWCVHIVASAFSNTAPGDAGGRLRNWLMMERMNQYFLCALCILFWKWKMKRAGLTLKGSLATEPKEAPILSEIAPTEWALP